MENIKFIRTLENLIDIKLLYKNIYLYGAGVRLNYFLEIKSLLIFSNILYNPHFLIFRIFNQDL